MKAQKGDFKKRKYEPCELPRGTRLYSSNKKETEFRQWLEDVNAEVIEIEKGRFKESGTMVGSVIVKIKK